MKRLLVSLAVLAAMGLTACQDMGYGHHHDDGGYGDHRGDGGDHHGDNGDHHDDPH